MRGDFMSDYHGIMQPHPGPGKGFDRVDTRFTHDSHPAAERSYIFPGGKADAAIEAARDRAHAALEAMEAGVHLPLDAASRKAVPIATGFLDYFPDAIVEVAKVSGAGNAQHGTTGWDRSKSTDEVNTMMRHFMDRGKIDTDGQRHTAKMVWRALAILQKEIEAER